MFRMSILIGLLLVVACLGGCEPEPATTDPSATPVLPFPDVEVTVYAPRSADDSSHWEIPFSEWSAQTGGKVSAVIYDDAAGPEALLTLLSQSTGGGKVVLFPTTWRGTLGVAKSFVEIPNELLTFDDINWQDVHKGMRDNVLEWNGDPSFLPLRTPLLLVYYRRDLLEAAGLQPPQTWDDYQTLLKNLNDWAPGLTAVEPWGETDRTTMFLARSVAAAKLEGNFSVFLNYLTAKPLIDSPAFVDALQRSLQDLSLLAPESRTLNADQCLLEIANGKAAIGIGSAFPSAELQFPEQVSEEWEIATVPLPGTRRVYDPEQRRWIESSSEQPHRVTLTGWDGWLVGVGSTGSATEKRAAWSLIRTLFVSIGADSFARGRMTPSRLSMSSTPYGIPLSGLDSNSHTGSVRDSLKDVAVVPELNFLQRDQFRAALDEELGRCLSGDQTPEATLTKVRERWESLLTEQDREAIRQSYSRGLGIPIRE